MSEKIDNKFYWSNSFDLDNWESADCMTFLFIPSKWWSISAWKFAFEFRADLLKSLLAEKRKIERGGV